MKNNIHPKLYNVVVTCFCYNKFNIYSTSNKNINIESCSSCHPFYTGKNKIIDNVGRIGKFNKKYKNLF